MLYLCPSKDRVALDCNLVIFAPLFTVSGDWIILFCVTVWKRHSWILRRGFCCTYFSTLETNTQVKRSRDTMGNGLVCGLCICFDSRPRWWEKARNPDSSAVSCARELFFYFLSSQSCCNRSLSVSTDSYCNYDSYTSNACLWMLSCVGFRGGVAHGAGYHGFREIDLWFSITTSS